MQFVVRESYETYTEDSIDVGEAEGRGWINEEGSAYDARDLARILRGAEPSSWPLRMSDGSRVWFTRHGDPDFRTGEIEDRSYFPRDARAARAMIRVWRVVNMGK